MDSGGPEEAQVQSYSPGGGNVPSIPLNSPRAAAMRPVVSYLEQSCCCCCCCFTVNIMLVQAEMTARFSRRLFGITLVVVSVLSTPLNAFSRRRSQLDTVYQPHSRRSYVRITSHHALSSCIIIVHYLTGPQYLTDCSCTVFSEREREFTFAIYAVARPSVVCLSSVVCNAHAPHSTG